MFRALLSLNTQYNKLYKTVALYTGLMHVEKVLEISSSSNTGERKIH
jgi:hypothetical protein